MSVTDELRAELTKRGIEYRWQDERTTYWYGTFDGREWCEWTAIEYDGYLRITCADCGELLTPEQAIEATLGRGECKARLYKPEYGMSDCTICECGEINDISANYCNRCGRQIKVVNE